MDRTRKRRDIGYIGHPEHIRPRRGERAGHLVRGRALPPIADRRRNPRPPTDATHAGPAHEPGDALPAHPPASRDEFGMDARRPIRATRVHMNGPNLLESLLVRADAATPAALPPRIVPAGRDLQHTAQGGQGMGGSVRRHEFEDLDGIEPVSRANQAAAFSRIVRSSRRRAFSRRSRRSSSRSTVVSPSARRPSSRSPWRTQFRMVCPDGSNSCPSDSGVRPARTNSTNRCRNSSGYGAFVASWTPLYPKG